MSIKRMDENDLSFYDEKIKNYINDKTTNIVKETISTTAPSNADVGDFWTELINDN